jgi:hypothetical protein
MFGQTVDHSLRIDYLFPRHAYINFNTDAVPVSLLFPHSN